MTVTRAELPELLKPGMTVGHRRDGLCRIKAVDAGALTLVSIGASPVGWGDDPAFTATYDEITSVLISVKGETE